MQAAHLLTAPVAIVAAGALLLVEGSDALTSSWHGATLGLVHLATLGFISTTLIVAFHRQLDAHPCARRPGGFGIGLVYVTLALGVAALAWGMLRGQSDFVFLAVGALGIMEFAFLIPATRALRRLEAAPAERRALVTALASFFVVVSLGVWVAHGHGGMRFPGPRPMWIQVHLCVGLLGWVGGLICAGLARADEAAPGLSSPRLDALLRLGLIFPVGVLFAQYFGAIGAFAAPLAALGSLPALFVIWWAVPFRVLFEWSGAAQPRRVPKLAVLGLSLGPLCAVLGVAAYLLIDPRFVLAFGWIAVWGWAGLFVHGLLLELAVGWRANADPGTSIAEPRGPRGSVLARLAAALHCASLLAGLLAIAAVDAWSARLTGALLVATGCVLCARVAAALFAGQPGVTGSLRSSA